MTSQVASGVFFTFTHKSKQHNQKPAHQLKLSPDICSCDLNTHSLWLTHCHWSAEVPSVVIWMDIKLAWMCVLQRPHGWLHIWMGDSVVQHQLWMIYLAIRIKRIKCAHENIVVLAVDLLEIWSELSSNILHCLLSCSQVKPPTF